MLDDPDIEVIHVCTPTALHAQMVKDALLAGKHVLSEKPLATSVADAEELVELAKKQGVRNCTNHNLRYYPLVQHMRRMREQGELGEILVVQGQYTQDYLLYDTDWNWRLDSKDSGPSCAMADIGSHFCDMAEHVTGLRITELCAELNTFHAGPQAPHRLGGELRRQAAAGRAGVRGASGRHRRLRRGAAAHRRPGPWELQRRPGVRRQEERPDHRDLRQQSVGRVEPGASRGAVDRQPGRPTTRSC